MPRNTSQSIFGRLIPPDDHWLARALPQAPIDPDLPIIDAHMHLWHRDNGHRYFVDDYAKDLLASGHNVAATVFVECHAMYRKTGPQHLRCVGETDFAVGMGAIADSGIYTEARVAAAIVGYADLTLGERTRETLLAHLEAGRGRFKGVRQGAKWDADPVVKGQVAADQPGLYLEPEFGRGLDALTSLGLSFDASVYHPQIPDVAALARAHPDASIVLIHMGSPVGHSAYAGQEAANYASWLAGIRELAACPNVAIKLGGILMHVASYDFTKVDSPITSERLASLWRPYVEACIEHFGAERCMASSNFPVDKAGFGYGTLWNMFKLITAGCSAHEKRLIYGDTARRVYRMD